MALGRGLPGRSAILVMLLLASACSDPAAPEGSGFWSFESGMEGWVAAAADTNSPDAGGLQPPLEWWARPSAERASHGSQSVEIFLENWNDAMKVWIVREFAVEPDRNYEVGLAFDFASRDYGDVNNFQILAGAAPAAPTTVEEVMGVGRVDVSTGNGAASDTGFLWRRRQFSFLSRSSGEGKLYVLVGVWGTWESPRTYYVDNVRVNITRR